MFACLYYTPNVPQINRNTCDGEMKCEHIFYRFHLYVLLTTFPTKRNRIKTTVVLVRQTDYPPHLHETQVHVDRISEAWVTR